MSFYVKQLSLGFKNQLIEPIWGQLMFYQYIPAERIFEQITEAFYFDCNDEDVNGIYFNQGLTKRPYECFTVALPKD